MLAGCRACIYKNENTGQQYWVKMQHLEPVPRFAHQLVYDHKRKVRFVSSSPPPPPPCHCHGWLGVKNQSFFLLEFMLSIFLGNIRQLVPCCLALGWQNVWLYSRTHWHFVYDHKRKVRPPPPPHHGWLGVKNNYYLFLTWVYMVHLLLKWWENNVLLFGFERMKCLIVQ